MLYSGVSCSPRRRSEDNPILDRLEPGEAPLDAAGQVHTPADRYTLAYRRAFIAFVQLAGSEHTPEAEPAGLPT